MLTRLQFTLALLAIGSTLSAQVPTIQWQQTLGGTAVDQGYDIVSFEDGSVAVGLAFSSNGQVVGNHGAGDAWVVRLNNNGDIVWQNCYGGSDYDNASAVSRTHSGGFVCAGVSRSVDGDVTNPHGDYDMWVFGIDSVGELLWQRTLGGSQNDWAFGVAATSDSGAVVVGRTFSADGDVVGFHGDQDAWVVKLNQFGEVLWQRALGGSTFDTGQDIIEISNGNLLVVGASDSSDGDVTSGQAGGGDAWVVLLSPDGELLWETTLGGSSSDGFRSITKSDDSGFVLAGTTQSNDGDVTGYFANKDGWVVKIDDSGSIIWQRAVGGNDVDELLDIQSDWDDGYIVVGQTKSNDGDLMANLGGFDGWILELSDDGQLDWSMNYGGASSENIYGIGLTSIGEYIACGLTNSTDGELASNHGNYDVWVARLSTLSTTIGEGLEQSNELRPNPASDFVQIDIKSAGPCYFVLTNTLGRMITEWRANGPISSLSLTGINPGLYYLSISQEGSTVVRRLIIE